MNVDLIFLLLSLHRRRVLLSDWLQTGLGEQKAGLGGQKAGLWELLDPC